MAFVGFAPAFNQALQQGQRALQQGQLQEQQAEQRLAELQKRFELQAQLPTAQERLAQGLATNPELRQLLEFQADPLGLKSRGLDIQEQGLEAKLQQLSSQRDMGTGQIRNYQFLISQGVNPKKAREIAFRRSPFDEFLSASLQNPNNKPKFLDVNQQ